MLKRKQPAFIGIVMIGLGLLIVWPNFSSSISHGMDCPGQGRAADICHAVDKNLEWEWLGHAIIAPGWKPNWGTVRRVYCAMAINDSDLPLLRHLSLDAKDWRMQTVAGDLVLILENLNGKGQEPGNSIFNPRNPDYILKDGCPH